MYPRISRRQTRHCPHSRTVCPSHDFVFSRVRFTGVFRRDVEYYEARLYFFIIVAKSFARIAADIDTRIPMNLIPAGYSLLAFRRIRRTCCRRNMKGVGLRPIAGDVDPPLCLSSLSFAIEFHNEYGL